MEKKFDKNIILIVVVVLFLLWCVRPLIEEYMTLSTTTPVRHHVTPASGNSYFTYIPPVSQGTTNCVMIECPDDFDDDTVCWRCHEITSAPSGDSGTSGGIRLSSA